VGVVPTPIATYLDLQMTPDRRYASGPVSVTSGETVQFSVDHDPTFTYMGLAADLTLPMNPSFFVPLGETTIVVENINNFTLAIPYVPGVTLTGLMLYVQAAVGDPADTAGFELTNVAAVRIDLF
jgi:hypothetical protein